MSGEEGRRKIRLLCPYVSKILDYVAFNDEKLDFRSIAGAFGLEPSTVKLNGHFISRDVELIASCVTWRSLLAFFLAKGLSTGKDEADAILVHGKLSKVGTKRAHYDLLEDNDLGLIKNKKLKDGESLIYGCNKRKLVYEKDSHSFKNLKLNIDNSFGKVSIGSGSPVRCSLSHGLKRTTRDDDVIGSTSCKKIR
ncbi:unnamed protein product [Cochlearia groenlandica]